MIYGGDEGFSGLKVECFLVKAEVVRDETRLRGERSGGDEAEEGKGFLCEGREDFLAEKERGRGRSMAKTKDEVGDNCGWWKG